jgi:hypothetical protein
MTQRLPTPYFLKTFRSDQTINHWPIHFAIIPSASNHQTEQERELQHLRKHYSWVRCLTLHDADAEHGQNCWAVNMGWQQACQTGIEFGQEAVFYVSDNTLSVTFCDERRKPFIVDGFLKRYRVREKNVTRASM